MTKNYHLLRHNEKQENKIPGIDQEQQLDEQGIEFEEISKENLRPQDQHPGNDDELSWFEMGREIFWRAIPMALSYAFGGLGNFTMLYFAGHIYEDANPTVTFAGISMSMLFTNISCRSLIIGMSGAVETLGSQNYGAKNYQEVGIVLQRSILILSLLVVPVVVCWFYVETIFLQLGVSPAICVVMKHFLRIRALAIPSEVVSQSYQKYLMSIGVTSPSLVGTVALIIFVFLFNFVFVHHFHGGYESLAWGFVVAKYLSDISIVLVSLREEPVQLTLQPFHWSALTNWWEFIELGLPSCAMLCSEWWAFEILCIFASRLGTNEVAAQTIIGQFSVFTFTIPLGLGVASSSFVGQFIGSQQRKTALRYAYTSLGCLLIVEAFICPGLIFLSKSLVEIFTTDPEVIEICVRVSHILAIFTFADGAQGVLSGIIRGAGKQFYGAVVNFLSYYCLGLPLSWYLTFHTSLGMVGLMIGLSVAVSLQSMIYLFYLCYLPDQILSSVLSPSELTSEGKKQPHQFVELAEWSDEMDQSSHSMLPHNAHHDSDDEEDPDVVDDIEASRREGTMPTTERR